MALFHLLATAGTKSESVIPPDANYLVKAWTPGDGLPQSSITSIAQTPDGYLWMGTFNGLARFDGVRFVVFNPLNTPALRSARIAALKVDRRGWLWIMTEEGFLTRVREGRFEALNGALGLPSGQLSARGLDPGGNLWLAAVAGDQGEVTLRDQEFGAGIVRDLVPSEVHSVVASDRFLWLRHGESASGGWAKIAPDSFRREVESTFVIQGGAGKIQYAPAADGDVWVVSSRAIGKLRHGGVIPLPEGVVISEPTEVVEDHSGNLLIGTWTQGLLRYSPDGQLRSVPLVGGASAKAVRVVMVDHEGNPWIGTDLAGVQRLQPRTFRTYLGAETGASGVVRSLAEDRNGRVWRATPEGLDMVSETGRGAEVESVGPGDSLWWAIAADHQGQMWAGSMGADLCRFAGTQAAKMFQLEFVRVISPAREGGVWIGTEHGILRANGDSLEEEKTPAGMTNQPVRAIVEQDGALWVGVFGGGVWRKDPSGWRQFGTPQGLADLRVISLYAENHGALWVGTAFGGLQRLQNGVITHFRAAGPRLPAMVACITDDQLGFLWLGSLDGIYRVAKQDLNDYADGKLRDLMVERFDRTDGLQTTEMSEGRQPTVLKAQDGRLWFATINGLSVVDPKAVPHNAEPPRVLIEEVSVDGSPVPLVAGRDLVIPARSQRIAFQYTGISLKGGPRVRFKRRLKGLEGDWEDAGAERIATYYNLPPGPYRFEVLAVNESGIWSTTPATLGLRALPAYWQARWFRFGIGLFLGGVGLAVLKLRLRALNQAQAAREAFSQQLIESQEQERRRISAGLHDGLGQALLMVKHQAGQAAKTPGVPPEAVERLARVAQSTQAAIDEVRGIVSALRPAMLESIGLSGALAAMLQQTAESGEVRLTWKVADMAGAILGGHDIELYRVVQEALNNILKHSRAAHARIELRREPDRWVLEIEDDGCGFDETVTLAGGGTGGFSLRGMRERLRILGGSLILVTRPGAGVRLRAEAPINEH